MFLFRFCSRGIIFPIDPRATASNSINKLEMLKPESLFNNLSYPTIDKVMYKLDLTRKLGSQIISKLFFYKFSKYCDCTLRLSQIYLNNKRWSHIISCIIKVPFGFKYVLNVKSLPTDDNTRTQKQKLIPFANNE